MRNLNDFAFRLEYERIKDLDPRLKLCKGTIPTAAADRISMRYVMFKSLFIQQLYSPSDDQLEREIADRISFRVLLGTTEIVPDFTTIWRFRERLVEKGVDPKIWAEMQRQLYAMNLKVLKGVMQDAIFITTDHGYAKADTSSRV
jgi:transposase, IS5 family